MEIKQILYLEEKHTWQINFVEADILPRCVDEETILKFELIQGKKLSEATLSKIIQFDQMQHFYHVALRYLQRRRTTQEVYNFLKYKQKQKDVVIQQIIQTLSKQHYLDDFAYGKAYIHDAISFHKRSFRSCAQKLKEKGLFDEVIQELQEWYHFDFKQKRLENENLRALIEQQIHAQRQYSLFERNRRIIAKMMQKGYNRDDITEILDEYNWIEPLSSYEQQQLLQKTGFKIRKMDTLSVYKQYMKKYNIPIEEVVDFFNNERMNLNGNEKEC